MVDLAAAWDEKKIEVEPDELDLIRVHESDFRIESPLPPPLIGRSFAGIFLKKGTSCAWTMESWWQSGLPEALGKVQGAASST